MRIALIAAGLCLLAILSVRPASATDPCHAQVPCKVGDRAYHALVPDGWDGESPLPVLLHFHGWGRQGTLIVKHGRIAGATRERGVLLLAPNGNGRSWSFWSPDTEDVPFADAVLADAAKRWPIDPERIYVSGYSWGGSMAWRYACAGTQRIAALLAISGTMPDQAEECAGPVAIRHVHGMSDTVMDYPFGPDGAIEGPVRLWLRENGCTDEPATSDWQAVKILPFQRLNWTNCASNRPVTLDVHTRGHFIPRFWIATQLDQLMRRKPSDG